MCPHYARVFWNVGFIVFWWGQRIRRRLSWTWSSSPSGPQEEGAWFCAEGCSHRDFMSGSPTLVPAQHQSLANTVWQTRVLLGKNGTQLPKCSFRIRHLTEPWVLCIFICSHRQEHSVSGPLWVYGRNGTKRYTPQETAVRVNILPWPGWLTTGSHGHQHV